MSKFAVANSIDFIFKQNGKSFANKSLIFSLWKTLWTMKEQVPHPCCALASLNKGLMSLWTVWKKSPAVWVADCRAGQNPICLGLTETWVNCQCPHKPGKIGLKAKEILTVEVLYICFDRWFLHFTGLTKDHFRSSSYEAKALLNEMIKKQLRIRGI